MATLANHPAQCSCLESQWKAHAPGSADAMKCVVMVWRCWLRPTGLEVRGARVAVQPARPWPRRRGGRGGGTAGRLDRQVAERWCDRSACFLNHVPAGLILSPPCTESMLHLVRHCDPPCRGPAVAACP